MLGRRWGDRHVRRAAGASTSAHRTTARTRTICAVVNTIRWRSTSTLGADDHCLTSQPAVAMNLPKTLLATAALALAAPRQRARSCRRGAAPVTVSRPPRAAVLFAGGRPTPSPSTAPGSFPGVLRCARRRLRSGAPWSRARAAFDTTYGAFAGRWPLRRLQRLRPRARRASSRPDDRWRTSLHGPQDRRRPRGRGAWRSGLRHVRRRRPATSTSCVRRAHRPTQRLSARGSIRSVAVATNARGDVLAAWDRHGTIEYRTGTRALSGSRRQGSVTDAAMHLSVSLVDDRRAVVAWVDQRVNEGGTGTRAPIVGHGAHRVEGLLRRRRQLETYPDLTIVAGVGVQTAYTAAGRGIVAWTGRTAVRAAFVNGRVDRHAAGPRADRADERDTTTASPTSPCAARTAVVVIELRHQDLRRPARRRELRSGRGGIGARPVSAPPVGGLRRRARAIVAWRDPASGVEVVPARRS